MSPGESIAALLGRSVLCWFFLIEAYTYGGDWDGTAVLLSSKGVPLAPAILLVSLILIVLSSVALLIGLHTRAAALTLFLLTVAATVIVHDYWSLPPGDARAVDFSLFSRNVAVAGGLLLLIGMGSGKFGIDNRARRKRDE